MSTILKYFRDEVLFVRNSPLHYDVSKYNLNYKKVALKFYEIDITIALIGSVILGCTLWNLTSSTSMRNFFEGTLPIIYVCLVLGFLFFFNGLLGWFGSYKSGGCMLKFFLFLLVLTVAAQIGGIISLSIMKIQMVDIVKESWREMNARSRYLIQEQMQCCGLNGPSELAHSTEPVDKSCYAAVVEKSINGTLIKEDPKYHDAGCQDKLIDWIYKNKIIWIPSLGGFLLYQVITILLSVSAISNLKSRSASIDSLVEAQTTYM